MCMGVTTVVMATIYTVQVPKTTTVIFLCPMASNVTFMSQCCVYLPEKGVCIYLDHQRTELGHMVQDYKQIQYH